MYTNVFDDLTYTSMKQFDGNKLRGDELAALRGRQFVRFHEYLQSLPHNQDVREVLALIEPHVDKMRRWAKTTREFENEEPFPKSWSVDEPRFLKGQLTKYFGRLGEPPARPAAAEDDDAAAVAPDPPAQSPSRGNQDANGVDDVTSAMDGVDIGDNEEGRVPVSMPGAFDNTQATGRPCDGGSGRDPRNDTEDLDSCRVAPLRPKGREPILQPGHAQPHEHQRQQQPTPAREPRPEPEPEPEPEQPSAIVTPPPPAPSQLPAEYWAFAHARSCLGRAEQRAERARRALAEATSAWSGFSGDFMSERVENGDADRLSAVADRLSQVNAENQDAVRALGEAQERVRSTRAAFRALARAQEHPSRRI